MLVAVKQFGDVPNVGDSIGSRIIAHILGTQVCLLGQEPADVPHLIGIGSIAHWADANSTLWGCGLIADWVELGARPARVLALRGYLTRDILHARGIPCGDVVGDVGLLLPQLFAPSAKHHEVGVVPHYVDADSPFVQTCRNEHIPIIDSLATPEAYLSALTACKRILSSSLHGVILAHAFGIPAVWVKMSPNVHGEGFKFHDYYSSLFVKKSDVPTMIPERDSLQLMLQQCWQPAALPDANQLSAVLLQYAPSLDLSAVEAAGA